MYYLNFFNDSEIYLKLPALFKSLINKLEQSEAYREDEDDELREINEDIMYQSL